MGPGPAGFFAFQSFKLGYFSANLSISQGVIHYCVIDASEDSESKRRPVPWCAGSVTGRPGPLVAGVTVGGRNKFKFNLA
jgi:hypothetical protein